MAKPTTGPMILAPALPDVCDPDCAETVGGTRPTEPEGSAVIDDVMDSFAVICGASTVGDKPAKEGSTVAEALNDGFVLVDDARTLVLERVTVELKILLDAAEIDDTPDSVNVKVVKSYHERRSTM